MTTLALRAAVQSGRGGTWHGVVIYRRHLHDPI